MSTMNPVKFVGGLLLEVAAVIAVLALLPALGARDLFSPATPTAAQANQQDFFAPNSLQLYPEQNAYSAPARPITPVFATPSRQPDFSRDPRPAPRFEPQASPVRERYVHEAQPVIRGFAPEPRFASRNVASDRGDLTPPTYAAPPTYSQRPYSAEQAAPVVRRNYRPLNDAPQHDDRSIDSRSSAYYQQY